MVGSMTTEELDGRPGDLSIKEMQDHVKNRRCYMCVPGMSEEPCLVHTLYLHELVGPKRRTASLNEKSEYAACFTCILKGTDGLHGVSS